MDLSLSQTQRQEQVLSAQMIQRMALLALPITELQQTIQKEVEENPAIEIPEEDFGDLRTTSEVPASSSSTKDPESANTDDFDSDDYENYSDSIYEGANRTLGDIDSDASDRKSAFLENSSADEVTLQTYLLDQLGTSDVSPELFETASIIITSLDSNGFFTKPPVELVEDSSLAPLIPVAIDLIQSFDPPGICVPDFKESLILQARREGVHGTDMTNFTTLVRDYFMDLRPGRFPMVAKAMGISEEDVQEYYDFLRTLSPFPGSEFASGDNSYAVPELSIHNDGGNLVLAMSKANLPNITISSEFEALADGLKGPTAKETSRYITESVNRAKLLISQIELRYSTLYKTALALMELQRDFFLEGISHLKPLTLKEVAEKVDVHETTISRISQSKWIETDWGLFQIKQLFSQGLKKTDNESEDVSRTVVKQRIDSIIQSNNTGKRLSDQKIADILTAEGIQIARRTVAKYRSELNIDSSYDR